jgi:hypothetical protein
MLILKRAVGYASLKMVMGISGKDHIRIYKFTMFYMIEKSRGTQLFKEGKGYVCDLTRRELDNIFM